jgi:cyclase
MRMSHVQMSLLVCLVLLVQQVAAGESVPRDCERVSGGVYCLYGQGGNMGILATDEGLLVVDSKYESLADSVLATIRAISGEPIRYLVNTHYHRGGR